MRALLLSLAFLMIGITSATYAQKLTPPSKHLKDYHKTRPRLCTDEPQNAHPYQQGGTAKAGFTENLLGSTVYDLQSNSSSPFGRLVRFDDGTFASVWTRGMSPTAYADRGTGYNYFNGTSWQDEPISRLETVRTGWPSIARSGVNGEAVVSHRNGTSPLWFLHRSSKGSGLWTESFIAPPAGASGIEWPRMVSSGDDHSTLHVIALTGPTANGGTVYNGQDGAIVYTKSTNDGLAWSTPVVLPGLGSDYYRAFSSDVYEFAEPQGNNLAFAIVDNSNDMILMRSSDNGETWQKTILWEHPYPMLDPATMATDTLYAPDGCVSLAFDKTGKLHVAFGVYRMLFLGDGTYTYWPGLSGIMHWTDDMPTFTGGDQKNILDPDLLDAQGIQIGYYNIDWNGDGELNYLDGDDFYGNYGCGWASMPQIAFDENDYAILIYSSLIENFDNGIQNYRHIWCRASSDNGATWGPVIDISDDPIHMFDECVFPSVSSGSDAENWYFTYMIDNEPGLAVQGDEDPPSDNYYNFYHLSKIFNGVEEGTAENHITIGQNYPNPVADETFINISLSKPSKVRLTLYNTDGQRIKDINYGELPLGLNSIKVSIPEIDAGVYFYRIYAGNEMVTGKLAVK